MKFRSTLELHGKTATGLVVPDEVVATLGGSKRPAVQVTINGFTYPSTVAARGGQFLIPVSAEVRKSAGIAAGDELEVEVELDTQVRTLEVPDDLAAGLAEDPVAAEFFAGLSLSRRRGYVDWILQAKKEETRQRRVAQAVSMLREGRADR
ncbi:uncharacterized protein DUF1905 [Jatrophihabitans sp. GAS493]|uniref:YdeI/OmpD-associated family protein n=1 Tax=Jatrophihabitans sp. GAS493 TaxID=1907575 RepID=UPI000BB9802C|nr:YdeI/OmpD-associated family protein [Jatrophihabitans sp. GAS493]SOD74759.1 uncharacterized protein DUF1905 [Jatrophihabitans sp. GAS493]